MYVHDEVFSFFTQFLQITEMAKIVLGGGISGLSTAFYLSKKFSETILYEGSDRLGGWIKTKEAGNGVYFEQGARTLRYGGLASENALELIEEIGLTPSIRPVGPGFQNRYFYVNNKLCHLPISWTALFKRNDLFNEPLLLPLLKDIFGARKKVYDESVYDFILRRFGKRYADVLSAVICGIYAGNACEISVKSAMKTVFEKEQKYGSIILGILLDSMRKKNKEQIEGQGKRKALQSGAWSFEKGMESLPMALSDYLRTKGNTEIHLNKKCSRIEFKNGEVLLDIDGEAVITEKLFSSLPSRELMKILTDEHSYLKDELSKIPFVSVAVVNLEYEGNILPLEAFGFLVPPNQHLPILGVIFDSCIYPQENRTILTVMMGGRWFEHYFGTDSRPEFILKTAIVHLQKILNIDRKPVQNAVSILKNCIPQYVVGHDDILKRINNYIAHKKLPLTLIGNSYNGVGIPDSILSARIGVELQSK